MTTPLRLIVATLVVAALAIAVNPTPLASVDSLDDSTAAECVDETAQSPARPEGAWTVLDSSWPPNAVGGLANPIRQVYDPFPTFDGVAIDVENGRVFFSDENRHSLLAYDRTAGSFSNDVTEPAAQIYGGKAKLGYIAGVEVDPAHREFYTVNNDGGDELLTFAYDDHANVAPKRALSVPHQSWDMSLARKRDEFAVTVQMSHAIAVFKRTAQGKERALRTIRGYSTELADPHGVFYDDTHNEIIAANHGNWSQTRPYGAWDPLDSDLEYRSGSFHQPSLTFHSADADGDVRPIRTIAGASTGLNWPMGIDVDLVHDEIAVANYGDHSIRIFRRGDRGDVPPVRVIKGPQTGIVGPVSVAVDYKNDEIWVANYGDHTAVVLPRTASGNVKPKRIVRNAPKDAQTCGFTNASAAAYDSKREKILVPN